MILVSAQPDSIYAYWQLIVQINNLIHLDFDDEYHILINESPLQKNRNFYTLAERLSKDKRFKFFFYKAPYETIYTAAVKPRMLQEHFQHYPLSEFFYLDADVIFRELPNWNKMPTGCWASNTASYNGAQYLKSKDPETFLQMCAFVGLPASLAEERQTETGGAHYILRDVAPHLWNKIYNDSIGLYLLLKQAEKRYIKKYPNDQPIMSWCAEMWATSWNLWLNGDYKTHPELDFCTPMQPEKYWYETKIMHNAGVHASLKTTFFFKDDFKTSSPFLTDLAYVNKRSVSKKYVEAIQSVLNSPLIRF